MVSKVLTGITEKCTPRRLQKQKQKNGNNVFHIYDLDRRNGN